jgi:hypothetical protein
MTHMSRGWKAGAVGLSALLALTGCLVGGYGGSAAVVGVGYDAGFYEPGGYEYGGWGPGYRVGPPRGVREERGARSARSAPSIPRAERANRGRRP